MSSFPEISSSNFSLCRIDGKLIQGPIDAPEFKFQFTSNFNFYRPCSIDFIWLDPPINLHATLCSDLTSCYWETLKIKCRYILAAAHEWKGDFDKTPLPQYIPNSLLSEISMIHPPFPPLDQLTYNFFLQPKDPAKIHRHVKIWQENTCQLSAWIEKAKERSAKIPECSWSWPASPFTPFPIKDSSSSTSINDKWRSNHCELDTIFMESPSMSTRAAHAFSVNSQPNSPKRTRAPSLAHSQCDGDDSNKRQLVLWQLSAAQLLKRYEALSHGEVASGSSLHEGVYPIV
ncbi:hypothetical protein JB92DRAFT_3107932 [Gautieria morchelliformis]|nr:hypothetical protein JB92DRAFT_3107932 [Gautieria morchelliformis]